jgi:hypothetical protein
MIFAVISIVLFLYLTIFRNKNGKPWLLIKKAVFACLAISLCLVLLEIVMILSEPYLFKGFYQYDPDLGFRVRAHSNGTNSFGFNDRDYELNKPDGIFRILVLGDSFGWAGGKEGNYTAILERKFESYYGRHRVDVINAGCPDTHTAEQFALLKKYGLQYHPDMVLVGFFAGNDFYDADPNRKRIIVNDTIYDIDKRFEVKILGRPIIFKSRLWQFIKQRFIAWKDTNEVHAWDSPESQEEDSDENKGTFSEKAYLEIERLRLGFCHIPSREKGAFGKNIDFILTTFTQMKELLDARNIELVVGIYPDEFQVDEDLLSQVLQAYNLERDEYDIEFMQRLLKRHLDDLNVGYTDLLDSFKKEAMKRRLYLLRDTHWNPAGNELAADMLFQFLLPHVDTAPDSPARR